MPVEVTTNAGRRFTLTQTDIGFVRRSTPLLILGKRTCTLCGYKTVRQQDRDRKDDDDKRDKKPPKRKNHDGTTMATTVPATSDGVSVHEGTSMSSDTQAAMEKPIPIEVYHECEGAHNSCKYCE